MKINNFLIAMLAIAVVFTLAISGCKEKSDHPHDDHEHPAGEHDHSNG